MCIQTMKTKLHGKDSGEFQIATTLLQDVYRLAAAYGYEELSEARLSMDINYVQGRCAKEGIVFLTETLPRLGKAFDQALLGNINEVLDSGFTCYQDTKLPTFLNGLFKLVLSADGEVLSSASPQAVRWIRQICFVFYKLKLPIPQDKIDVVLKGFINNEVDLENVDQHLASTYRDLATCHRFPYRVKTPWERVILNARWYLQIVLADFSLDKVYPAHGPGATSAMEEPWEKWDWTSIPERVSSVFPLDAFFFASIDHMRTEVDSIGVDEPFARVILVPKDSRGPRLISAEPKELQYLQQGIMRELVRIVETHPLTRNSVFFTDQKPNQFGALLGSILGDRPEGYATLDLKDASDRVSLWLVRLLFPIPVMEALESSRSIGTVLPGGQRRVLRKHAPMGSANCFPVMALCIWALLAAGYSTVIAHDPHLRRRKTLRELEGIHVYGDDVVVPNSYVDTAITILERSGLSLNLNKCCTKGFFRESCGVDAFQGINVTPLRISVDWNTSSAQQQLCSFCEYSRNFNKAGYYSTGLLLARRVQDSFPGTPCERDLLYEDAPFLSDEYSVGSRLRTRTNYNLQRVEVRVRVPVNRTIRRKTRGWVRLLRYFNSKLPNPIISSRFGDTDSVRVTSTDAYTKRHDSVLTWRWCATAP